MLWLVLFKLSSNPVAVLAHYQTRSLNFIPFAGASLAHISETISNIIVFIPFGLLLGVNFKGFKIWHTVAYIGSFSVAMEVLQYIFAIGTSDITDVITNTLGGLIGLWLYKVASKRIDNKKLDYWIAIVTMVVIVILLLLRALVFRVKY